MHQIGWPEKSSSSCNINAADDDEYIDIEVSSSPQTKEFGYQMTSIFTDKHHLSTFPAKHILYKGKLLHPTLQIVQNLLQATTTTADLNSIDEEDFIIMDIDKLNRDDTKHNPEKSWSDKLRVMKKRLQASKAFLRSLFGKCACKDVSSAKAPGYSPAQTVKQGKGFHLKSMAAVERKQVVSKEDKVISSHRSLSFSSAEAKRRSPIIKCLAASSSSLSLSFSSSTEFNELKFHKRSYSFTSSDIEGPIEAAIAHCKKSQFKNLPTQENH